MRAMPRRGDFPHFGEGSSAEIVSSALVHSSNVRCRFFLKTRFMLRSTGGECVFIFDRETMQGRARLIRDAANNALKVRMKVFAT